MARVKRTTIPCNDFPLNAQFNASAWLEETAKEIEEDACACARAFMRAVFNRPLISHLRFLTAFAFTTPAMTGDYGTLELSPRDSSNYRSAPRETEGRARL